MGDDALGTHHEPIADGGVEVESIEYEEYRFIVVCKECGVVDESVLTRQEAVVETESPPPPVDEDPAFAHYDRTGHTCARLNYTNAPPDVREMLDGGESGDIDWERVLEWLSDQSKEAE